MDEVKGPEEAKDGDRTKAREEAEAHRKRTVNLARVENLQKALEETGYFPRSTASQDLNIKGALLNLLVDFLLLTDKNGLTPDLAWLQAIAGDAHFLFEKEPPFLKS